MIEEFNQCPEFYLDLCRKNIDKDGQVMLVSLEQKFLSRFEINVFSSGSIRETTRHLSILNDLGSIRDTEDTFESITTEQRDR